MSDRNIFSIQEKIGLLEKKVADLEYEIEVAEKVGRSEAYIIVKGNILAATKNDLAATKIDLAATKNEHVELMKKENFLLESQKMSGTMAFPFYL